MPGPVAPPPPYAAPGAAPAPTAPEGEGGGEPEEDVYPPVTRAQVAHCSFPSWYPKFRRDSIKSRVIPLSQDVIEYLKSDEGIFLPTASEALPTRQGDEGAVDWGNEDEEDDGDLEGAEPPPEVNFAGLEQRIREVIEEFDGEAVPKLNWSSPKDAVWINQNGSLKCTNPSEVLLMLRSSDNVSHDLFSAFDTCVDAEGGADAGGEAPVLVLRKWYDLKPSMEFRCFVKEHELIGLCQRDVANFYPFLPGERGRVKRAISHFHEERIAGDFPDPDYVYDVYITNDWRVKVLDFNPFGGSTLPMLFTWRELVGIGAACGLDGGGGAAGEETEDAVAVGAAAGVASDLQAVVRPC